MSDYNERVIREFRENRGRVGGGFEGRPMLLLHHVGARSGKARVTPLMYLADGERYVIFASKAGAPENPAWYHNLRANPETEIEVGQEKFRVLATELTGEERERLFAAQVAAAPTFAEYQTRTERRIPVIALTRRT